MRCSTTWIVAALAGTLLLAMAPGTALADAGSFSCKGECVQDYFDCIKETDTCRATCNDTFWTDVKVCFGIRDDREARRQCFKDAIGAYRMCLDNCGVLSCGELARACWQSCG